MKNLFSFIPAIFFKLFKDKQSETTKEDSKQSKEQQLEEKHQKELRDRSFFKNQILYHGNQDWGTILSATIDSKGNIIPFGETRLREIIATRPLKEGLEISEVKSIIIWGGHFKKVLKVLEYLANSNDDILLRKLITQLADFQKHLEPYKKYTGYKALQKELLCLYPTIFEIVVKKLKSQNV